ncbi:hypothetical protein [Pseudonocardia sp. N23]|uniref:hypothetical protein n=1 Tax=Pseudonocardia sp. N23 TaxID=1987376 RepID=UPI000BFD0A73|nr:hypothetical protein [Pseudonocardia sp. N23]GAY11520.1 hypothetical protein TOK_6030 [Pseudonocardia sp. N23]
MRPTSAPVRPGLLGRGLLIVHGPGDPAGHPGFDDWYTHEHLPERVATPGFRRARRWVAPGPDPVSYLAVYETDDVAVLRSPAYLAALDDPTPGTARWVPVMSRMSRTVCDVVHTAARGEGGDLVLAEFGPATQDPDPLRDKVVGELATDLLHRSGTLAVHVADVDPAVTTARDATGTYRDVPTGVGRRFLLVEGAWPDPASADAVRATVADGLSAAGADIGTVVVMRLLARLTRDQVVPTGAPQEDT